METMKKYAVKAFKAVKDVVQYTAGIVEGYKLGIKTVAKLANLPVAEAAVTRHVAMISSPYTKIDRVITDEKYPPNALEKGRRMGVVLAMS